jgi:Kdo2-lipid IVA lauroyltransferase/acyltransferase
VQAFLYYLSLPFIYLFSILPIQLLYKISNGLFYINYYFVKYRRTVVQKNLKNSFPSKSIEELEILEKKFFRILIDYIVESLKSFTISKKSLLKKGIIIQNEEMNALARAKKNIIISVGHVGNQELVNQYLSATDDFHFTVKAAYHQLQNPYYEGLFYKSRTRFGSRLFTMKQSYAAIDEQNIDCPFAFFLVNDQSAPPDKSYWTTFLNQETSFYKGMAVFAQKYNMPVFFMHLDRHKRGHFTLSFIKITDTPNEITESEIIEKHVQLLEKNIRQDPPIWLWSHNRWKHKRPKLDQKQS